MKKIFLDNWSSTIVMDNGVVRVKTPILFSADTDLCHKGTGTGSMPDSNNVSGESKGGGGIVRRMTIFYG